MNRKQMLNLLGYTHELIQYQEIPNLFFNGRTQLTDLGSFDGLCRKANELNRIDNVWGIYYYVREIA